MNQIWKRREREKMPVSRSTPSPLMKPLSALAGPGMFLVYKYNEYKRQQQEQHKRKAAERELEHLNHKIDKLLTRIDDHDSDIRKAEEEEECVVCLAAKATMQTYPCGHKVVCRKCFIKTIQVAVAQRCLPLRCVICRSRILKLRQSSFKLPTSPSQLSNSPSRPSLPIHRSTSPKSPKSPRVCVK
ncbi:hypothetical protein ScPMuIL_016160 [Solemya velum]